MEYPADCGLWVVLSSVFAQNVHKVQAVSTQQSRHRQLEPCSMGIKRKERLSLRAIELLVIDDERNSLLLIG